METTIDNDSFVLVNIGSRKKIDPKQIIMLQADINYTNVYLIDGSSILVSYTLKKLAMRFVEFEHFIRPNKSILLNMKYVTDFDGSFLQISFPSGEVLKNTVVSRRKREFIAQRITDFTKGLKAREATFSCFD